MELLNYNKTVVQFYYSRQLRRPKLAEELSLHYENCFLAGRLAGRISAVRCCSSVRRLVHRHFQQVAALPL